MTDGKSTAESSQDSIWADCADCGSCDTDIAPVGDENPIICNDCGARTEGINKVGDLEEVIGRV